MKDWIYTSEQAKAIKNGDIDLRNKFYFDNYERIKIFAKSFLSRGRISSKSVLCSLEDLLQQVYLDLPFFCFDTPQTITFSLKRRCFYLCSFGGLSYFVENRRSPGDYERFFGNCFSLESKLETDRPFIDKLCYSPSLDEELIKQENYLSDYSKTLREIFEKYFAKRQTDFLMLWCDGYSDVEACRKIGTTVYNVHKVKAFDRLRIHYIDVVDTLCSVGCDVAFDYVCRVPALLEQSKQKLTSTLEKKAKEAERMRLYRAKKKEQKIQTA